MNGTDTRGGFLRSSRAALLKSRLTRPFMLRPRLIIGILAGLFVGFLCPLDWQLATRLLLAWNAGVLLYIVLTFIMMVRDDLDRFHQRTSVQDEGRFVILTISIVAAVFSIAAIVVQLAATKDMSGLDKYFHVGLAATTIVTGWTFIHLTFALHYAHEYASERRNRPDLPEKIRGGLDFADTLKPDYSDFLYFAFIIGVASQTADVAVCSPTMRRIALVHGIVSFFYNTTILALTINIAAGLI
ncbi:MAG: hypothetical protein RIQ68_2261 [Pseudomonadota bacterium]